MKPIAPKGAPKRKERTMKKTTALVVLTLVLCCLLTACGLIPKRSSRTAEKPTTEASAPTTYSVYLDFDFEQNLFMATYDIEIYLDEAYVGVIEHGKAFTKQIEAEVGQHTFVFYKETDNSVSATKKCDITQDCTVRCTLHSNTNSIDVKKFTLREGIAGNLTMPKVVDLTYKDAKAQLEKAGFTNVSYRTPGDANIWEEGNWTVIAQSVEPGTVADKNVEIVLSCEKPGYIFEEETEPATDHPAETATTEVTTPETDPPVTDAATTETLETEPETETATEKPASSSRSRSQRLEDFMELVRTSAAVNEDIQVEVRRFTDTVYLDVTMDGMTATARSVVAYGGEYRTLWDDSMERLKELNQQYRDIMVNDFDLKNYNFSLCLMNDEDPNYVLVEFVNGKLKRSVVD